jgi:hypothetical protein
MRLFTIRHLQRCRPFEPLVHRLDFRVLFFEARTENFLQLRDGRVVSVGLAVQIRAAMRTPLSLKCRRHADRPCNLSSLQAKQHTQQLGPKDRPGFPL